MTELAPLHVEVWNRPTDEGATDVFDTKVGDHGMVRGLNFGAFMTLIKIRQQSQQKRIGWYGPFGGMG